MAVVPSGIDKESNSMSHHEGKGGSMAAAKKPAAKKPAAKKPAAKKK
jgi:hypothetical protein